MSNNGKSFWRFWIPIILPGVIIPIIVALIQGGYFGKHPEPTPIPVYVVPPIEEQPKADTKGMVHVEQDEQEDVKEREIIKPPIGIIPPETNEKERRRLNELEGKRRKTPEEQVERTKLEFKKLVEEEKDSKNWQIKDECKQIIANKRILLIYSEENLDTAAEIVRCLRSLGAIVNYEIAREASFSGQPGNIYYPFNDFEIATAIQSAISK